MGGSRTEVLLLLLVGIVLLLMVALIGLFLRMEQLQREVLAALARCARPRNPPDCPLGRKPLRSPFPTFPASRYLWTRWRGGRCCWSSPPPLSGLPGDVPAPAGLRSEASGDGSGDGLAGERGGEPGVAEEQGLTFPVVEGDERVMAAYGVPGTPYFYVLDGEGVIVRSGFAVKEEEIAALVAGESERG